MISVVIPVLDGAHVLPTTLPAVLALRDVAEVVWVDDGSRDATPDLLVSVDDDRVRVLTLPTNRGRAAARNAGVAATAGDVLVFLDADVEPPPHAARALAEAVGQPGAAAAVARLGAVVTDPDEPYQDYVAHHARGPAPGHPASAPLDWRFFLSGACAVRRDALAAAGGFPEGVPYGEDVALGCKLAARAPDGLRVADATVRLHDVGDLGRAVENARVFGQSAWRVGEACAGGALDGLRRARRLAPVAALAAPALRALAERLEAGPVRRKAVRYLLASTALAATRRA